MATTDELTFGRHLFSRQPWQLNWFQRSNEPRAFKKYWIIMTQIPQWVPSHGGSCINNQTGTAKARLPLSCLEMS